MYIFLFLVFVNSVVGVSFDIEDISGRTKEEKIIIAMVNMDKIMDAHPYIKTAKFEYEKYKSESEQEISQISKEIEELKMEIENTSRELLMLTPETTSYIELTTIIEINQQRLKELIEKMETKKLQQAEVLKKMEEETILTTMANLYKLIEEFAIKNDIYIVVDEKSIIYGRPKVDITERVIEFIKKKVK